MLTVKRSHSKMISTLKSKMRVLILNMPLRAYTFATFDEQTLKISSHHLEQFQYYCHLTEKFWQLPAYMHTNGPTLYASRQAIARISQLNGNNSETI